MQRFLGAVFVVAMVLGGRAVAAPLLVQEARLEQLATNVKVICDDEGRCVRPAKRRPVARWVYGDGNFYGPYSGPGYYGDPRLRYRVFPYFWW